MGRVACRSAAVIAAKPDRTSRDAGPLDRNRGWRRGRASVGRVEHERGREREGAQYYADDQGRTSLMRLDAIAGAQEAGWLRVPLAHMLIVDVAYPAGEIAERHDRED